MFPLYTYNYWASWVTSPVPTDNLICAWNSESVVKATSGPDELVSQLNAVYGTSNVATQSTDANKPKWLASQINGLPALHIPDGDTRYLDFTKILTPTATLNYTIYIVIKHDQNSSTNFNRFLSGDTGAGESQLRTTSATTGNVGWGISGTGNRFSDEDPTPNAWKYYTAQNDHLYQNGVEESYAFTNNVLLEGLSRLFTGVGLGSTSNFVGYMAEVLIYDTIHNATIRGNIESYLSTKYSL